MVNKDEQGNFSLTADLLAYSNSYVWDGEAWVEVPMGTATYTLPLFRVTAPMETAQFPEAAKDYVKELYVGPGIFGTLLLAR
jgi:hypothetical protein